MTARELRDILHRHGRGSRLPDALAQALEDREALLVLAHTLAVALYRVCGQAGIERCPLCGDPECPAAVLEELGQIRLDGLGRIL